MEAFSIFERQFIELQRRSKGIITTKTAGEFACSIAVGLFAPITGQIDPIKIGEMQRAVSIAHHYGIMLNSDSNRIERLIFSYPSHSCVIDYKEAKEIFDNVREPNSLEALLEENLIIYFRQEKGVDCVRTPYEERPIIIYLDPEKIKSDDESSDHEMENSNESIDGEKLSALFDKKRKN